MEAYFATILEDVRHERSLILLLSLVEPDILKQSKFTDHEVDIIKNLALEKFHRQRNLKDIIALVLLENQIDDIILTLLFKYLFLLYLYEYVILFLNTKD